MLNQPRGPDDVFNHILHGLFDQHSLHRGEGGKMSENTKFGMWVAVHLRFFGNIAFELIDDVIVVTSRPILVNFCKQVLKFCK